MLSQNAIWDIAFPLLSFSTPYFPVAGLAVWTRTATPLCLEVSEPSASSSTKPISKFNVQGQGLRIKLKTCSVILGLECETLPPLRGFVLTGLYSLVLLAEMT